MHSVFFCTLKFPLNYIEIHSLLNISSHCAYGHFISCNNCERKIKSLVTLITSNQKFVFIFESSLLSKARILFTKKRSGKRFQKSGLKRMVISLLIAILPCSRYRNLVNRNRWNALTLTHPSPSCPSPIAPFRFPFFRSLILFFSALLTPFVPESTKLNFHPT